MPRIVTAQIPMLIDSKGREVILEPKFGVCWPGVADGPALKERELFKEVVVGKELFAGTLEGLIVGTDFRGDWVRVELGFLDEEETVPVGGATGNFPLLELAPGSGRHDVVCAEAEQATQVVTGIVASEPLEKPALMSAKSEEISDMSC